MAEIKPDVLTTIGDIEITNSLITTILVFLILAFTIFRTTRKLNTFNPGKWQLSVEMFFGGFRDITQSILGDHSQKIFSFLMTIFIFVIASNWIGITPLPHAFYYHSEDAHYEVEESYDDGQMEEDHDGDDDDQSQSSNDIIIAAGSGTATDAYDTDYSTKEVSIKDCFTSERDHCSMNLKGETQYTDHPKHLFRPGSADFTFTLMLGVFSVVITNLLGIRIQRLSYFKKYFDFSGVIQFFVGILELVSEIGKIISFTFRLFGNIFAGEVLLAVMTGLSMGLATFPFMGLEIFVGFVQAFVFFMLTLVFLSLAKEHH